MTRIAVHHTRTSVTPCGVSVCKKNFRLVRRSDRYHGKSRASGAAWSGSSPELRKSQKVQLLSKLSISLKPVSLIPVVGPYAKVAQETAASGAAVTGKYAKALAADLNLVRKEINELLSELPRRIVIIMDDIDRLTA